MGTPRVGGVCLGARKRHQWYRVGFGDVRQVDGITMRPLIEVELSAVT